MDIKHYISKTITFENVAHKILSKQESAISRIITIEETYRTLDSLSVKQDDLFKQALSCAENKLYRAAHVMSWAAFVDFIEEYLEKDKFTSIKAVRPKWKIDSIHDLREGYPESQIIDAMKEANEITKNEAKAFHGLLNKRNECAHPSDFNPDLNSTLGYISEILQRLSILLARFT